MDIKAAKERLKTACDAWKQKKKAGNWKDLAEAVDRAEETVRLYTKGSHLPPLDILPALCHELGVTPMHILFGIEEDVPGTVRIGVSTTELELLHLFRTLGYEQQQEVITFIQFRVATTPLPANVKPIR